VKAILIAALAACGDNLPAPDAAPIQVDAGVPDALLPTCTSLGCPGSNSCFSPTICVCNGQRCEPTTP